MKKEWVNLSWLGLLILAIVLYVIGALVASLSFLTTVGIVVGVVALIWLLVDVIQR